MSSTNKIPNSDIIGYEGAVGQEKAIHKTHWQATGRTWKSSKKANWVKIGVGRYMLIPIETRKAAQSAEVNK